MRGEIIRLSFNRLVTPHKGRRRNTVHLTQLWCRNPAG